MWKEHMEKKKQYLEKRAWRKNSSVSVAKTDLTPEVQKLGDCKSYRRKRGMRISNTASQSILHSLRQAKHYLAQSKGADVVVSRATRPCWVSRPAWEGRIFKWCCNIMSAGANGFLYLPNFPVLPLPWERSLCSSSPLSACKLAGIHRFLSINA